MAEKNETGHESRPEQSKPEKKAGRDLSEGTFVNVFRLEDSFPDATAVFSPSIVSTTTEAIVVIDTNALLLPYALDSGELASLMESYRKLSAENRLFIPARVAREFISNRDEKLTGLSKGLSDESSRIPLARPLPRLLRSAPGHDALMKAGADLDTGRRAYQKAVAEVRDTIEAWRGDDPVTVAYREIFNVSNIIEHDGDREEVLAEWKIRLRDKIPPGFKDGSKEDTGIGDFLVWKSVLKLGRERQKDLIFVTGEKKTDWMVRSNKDGVYPRPELLLEYRNVSNGQSIRLSSLARLLQDLEAPGELVEQVKSAEESAIERRRTSYVLIASPSIESNHRSIVEESFDYSKNDGNLRIATNHGDFDLRFSKASDERIHFHKAGQTARIARAKDMIPDEIVSIDNFDSTSSAYTIGVGEAFLAENTKGDILVGRIDLIQDDTRNNAPADEVRFRFAIFQKGSLAIAL